MSIPTHFPLVVKKARIDIVCLAHINHLVAIIQNYIHATEVLIKFSSVIVGT